MTLSIQDFIDIKNRTKQAVFDDITCDELYQQGREDYPISRAAELIGKARECYLMGYNVSVWEHNNGL
jgi:hypothetical protein